MKWLDEIKERLNAATGRPSRDLIALSNAQWNAHSPNDIRRLLAALDAVMALEPHTYGCDACKWEPRGHSAAISEVRQVIADAGGGDS